eukprot:663797-Rhodomonas_salina.1
MASAHHYSWTWPVLTVSHKLCLYHGQCSLSAISCASTGRSVARCSAVQQHLPAGQTHTPYQYRTSRSKLIGSYPPYATSVPPPSTYPNLSTGHCIPSA